MTEINFFGGVKYLFKANPCTVLKYKKGAIQSSCTDHNFFMAAGG